MVNAEPFQSLGCEFDSHFWSCKGFRRYWKDKRKNKFGFEYEVYKEYITINQLVFKQDVEKGQTTKGCEKDEMNWPINELWTKLIGLRMNCEVLKDKMNCPLHILTWNDKRNRHLNDIVNWPLNNHSWKDTRKWICLWTNRLPTNHRSSCKRIPKLKFVRSEELGHANRSLKHFMSATTAPRRLKADDGIVASSVTRWLDYFSIFGYMQQWKLAQ